MNGEGIDFDYNTTAYWYDKAAKQGDAEAQYNLGMLYYHGKYIAQDYTKAEPPRVCRRLNAPREYDNENTKLYPLNERAIRPYAY